MKEFIKKLILSSLVVIFIKTFTILFPQPSIYHWISLLFAILLFYYLVIPSINKLLLFSTKIIKRFYPSIAILNGNIIGPLREYKCERSFTNVTGSMWFSELKDALKDKTLKKIKMIPALEISSKFSIIINPFGDNFPEEDLKLHKTFYRICEYVKNGGLFICTGGSFWSHQNTILSESSDWALKNLMDGGQSLKYSFMFFDFGAVMTGSESEPKSVECYQKVEDKKYFGALLEKDTEIKRFRAIRNQSSDYVPLIRQKGDESFPVALIRYGNGYLIHAGMFLTSAETTEFKILIKIIKFLVFNRFKNF